MELAPAAQTAGSRWPSAAYRGWAVPGDGWCPPELPDQHSCASFALSALRGQCDTRPTDCVRTQPLEKGHSRVVNVWDPSHTGSSLLEEHVAYVVLHLELRPVIRAIHFMCLSHVERFRLVLRLVHMDD
jgi:hypothetical protein